MSLLCALGFHRKIYSSRYVPSIAAPVVTDYFWEVSCTRCHKLLKKGGWHWDGNDFVDHPENRTP